MNLNFKEAVVVYRIFTSTEQLMRHPLMRKDESTDTESGPFSQVHQAPSLPLVSMCAACETGTVKPHRQLNFCQEFRCFLDPLCLHGVCGFGMFIPDPDFFPFRIADLGFRILDPTTASKEEGGKCVVLPFSVSTNIIKN